MPMVLPCAQGDRGVSSCEPRQASYAHLLADSRRLWQKLAQIPNDQASRPGSKLQTLVGLRLGCHTEAVCPELKVFESWKKPIEARTIVNSSKLQARKHKA